MEFPARGIRRYPVTSSLLASSANLGWSTVSVELRAHGACEAPTIVPQYVEICLAVEGNPDAHVMRRGPGFRQEDRAETGAIWLSPAGVGKEIGITAPVPQTIHIYLPTAPFDRLRDDYNLPFAPSHSIRLAAGIRDDVIRQMGQSLLWELSHETAASRMYVEIASLALAARLVQKYSDGGPPVPIETSTHGLDQLRLRRVLDYIAANIENDLALCDLAQIAGYSPFHFARKFTLTMGVPPHRYVSRMRLQKAMAELAAGKLALAQIALNAQFSSQSSFTRAFHRATGVTPKAFRRDRL